MIEMRVRMYKSNYPKRRDMRKVFWFLTAVSFIWLVGLITDAVFANYSYSNSVGSYWELAIKASTIKHKSEYLNQYVAALDKAGLADSSALWLKTPNESVEQNKVALKSLQGRLEEIKGMDPSSFQYQQAMAQITAQEQDENSHLVGTFKEAWYMSHHFFLWDWMGPISMIVMFGLLCLSIAGASGGFDDLF